VAYTVPNGWSSYEGMYSNTDGGRTPNLRHPEYKARACLNTLRDAIMSIYKVFSIHLTHYLFVNCILLAFLEFFYFCFLEFENGLCLSGGHAVA
jgi:hypothetical protein